MAEYIALLRGVNVGGNTLKMERLRAICENLGFAGVQTYLQSGNVLLTCNSSAAAVGKLLETKLAGQTRLPVSVIVRTRAELKRVLQNNPFPEAVPIPDSENKAQPFKLYVAFLAAAPQKGSLKKLDELQTGPDQFRVAGKEIYLRYAVGYGSSKMTNNLFEKLLGIRATTRNWNTVQNLMNCRPDSRIQTCNGRGPNVSTQSLFRGWFSR